MPNLKEVRVRIKSVQNTQQITSAMKMVSAAKLRRAQDAILKMRPYAQKLTEIMSNLSKDSGSSSQNVYSQVRKEEKILIVAETSNRGLCGALNSNVLRRVNTMLETTYMDQFKAGNVYFICLGKKASEFFTKKGYNVVSTHNEVIEKVSFENTKVIAEEIMKQFAAGTYDKVVIVYNQFKNAAVQSVIEEQFLPVLPPKPKAAHLVSTSVDYIYQPDKATILTELIPKSLKVQFHKTVLDTSASEHGARMTSMHKATDNANELIKQLKLTYNKARQAVITNEILEIVSGANALKG